MGGYGRAVESEQVVEIYTDGACSGNPGPGGWGAVLRYGRHEKELYGGDAGPTTNNRMELTAPIQALRSLHRPSVVRIYTDSTYVRDGVLSWMPKWKRNGWMTSQKQPVKNADLWRELDAECAAHQIEWHWVKGHAGHPENERADRLAVRGVQEVTGVEPDGEPDRVGPRRGGSGAGKAGGGGERTARMGRLARAGEQACGAVTKVGKPCPISAGESGLCHIHDPALQCGAPKKNGKPCGIATGGGRCEHHRGAAPVGIDLFTG